MKDEIIVYTEQESKRFMWQGYNSLHKTLHIDQLSPSYYITVSRLFNGSTKEFFMLVINRMIANYRGKTMPTEADFKKYIKEQKESDRLNDAQRSYKAPKIEHMTQRVLNYEKEALRVFYEDFPQYRGVLTYDKDPKTQKEIEAAKAYFGVLKAVHVKHNPDSIFRGSVNA